MGTGRSGQETRGETGGAAGTPQAGLVRLAGVSCSYGAMTAVHPTDLDIMAGDFVAILGPSGCGKSTLLRMIGGFVAPSAGRIEIDGHDMTATPPERRPVNTVFQGYGLFPHMNVRQNVGYGLKIAGLPAAAIAAAVDEMLALTRLTELAGRPVSALSGGQQQRVALARALILKPKVLLLDEPLAALDLKLRQALQDELRQLHEEIGGTFIFVTHDQTEALALANRIAVMDRGRIVQVGDATEIYRRPKTEFVARFIGDGNFLEAEAKAGTLVLAIGPRLSAEAPAGPVTVVLRPEDLRLAPAGSDGPAVSGVVVERLYLGSFTRLAIRTAAGPVLAAHLAGNDPTRFPAVGTEAALTWSAADQILIPGRAG